MATEKIYPPSDSIYLELTRQEATNIVGLLTAQLAGVALSGCHGGACPEVPINTATLYLTPPYIRVFVVLDDSDNNTTQHETLLEDMRIISLTRGSAANIIALLGAQLANVSLLNLVSKQPAVIQFLDVNKKECRLVIGLAA